MSFHNILEAPSIDQEELYNLYVAENLSGHKIRH